MNQTGAGNIVLIFDQLSQLLLAHPVVFNHGVVDLHASDWAYEVAEHAHAHDHGRHALDHLPARHVRDVALAHRGHCLHCPLPRDGDQRHVVALSDVVSIALYRPPRWVVFFKACFSECHTEAYD